MAPPEKERKEKSASVYDPSVCIIPSCIVTDMCIIASAGRGAGECVRDGLPQRYTSPALKVRVITYDS